jgi:hemoglobin-like flavoprotein
MAISADDRIVIYKTFDRLAGHWEELSEVFYENFLQLAPQQTAKFHLPMQEQSRRWRKMFIMVIVTIDRYSRIKGDLVDLGIRHIGYGVNPQDFDIMGEALLLTLEQFFGKDFTPQVRQAWRNLYDTIVDTMQNGGKPNHA